MQVDHPALSELNRLSAVKHDKDIKGLSWAIFPGTHCPLFGVTLTTAGMTGLSTIVVGTEECTFYTKDFAIGRNGGVQNDQTWSYAMSSDEVVFGCASGLRDAIRRVDATGPDAILLVSTCIPELIGEDIGALCDEMQAETRATLLSVKAEHMSCNSHMPGIIATLEVLSAMMKPQPVRERTVNLLGWRGDGLEQTELMAMLTGAGVSVHMSLPTKGAISDLISAPAAQLNLVLDFTALPLARRMEKKFGTPYVVFDHPLSLEDIDQRYRAMATHLGIDLDAEIARRKRDAASRIAKAAAALQGKTFLYGNSMCNAFAYSALLAEQGMVPLIMQARELYEGDDVYIQRILAEGHDPYVTRIANIAPLKALYPVLKPNFYIGHENPMALMAHGIVQSAGEGATGLGFELPAQILESLCAASARTQSMQARHPAAHAKEA